MENISQNRLLQHLRKSPDIFFHNGIEIELNINWCKFKTDFILPNAKMSKYGQIARKKQMTMAGKPLLLTTSIYSLQTNFFLFWPKWWKQTIMNGSKVIRIWICKCQLHHMYQLLARVPNIKLYIWLDSCSGYLSCWWQ